MVNIIIITVKIYSKLLVVIPPLLIIHLPLNTKLFKFVVNYKEYPLLQI